MGSAKPWGEGRHPLQLVESIAAGGTNRRSDQVVTETPRSFTFPLRPFSGHSRLGDYSAIAKGRRSVAKKQQHVEDIPLLA